MHTKVFIQVHRVCQIYRLRALQCVQCRASRRLTKAVRTPVPFSLNAKPYSFRGSYMSQLHFPELLEIHACLLKNDELMARFWFNQVSNNLKRRVRGDSNKKYNKGVHQMNETVKCIPLLPGLTGKTRATINLPKEFHSVYRVTAAAFGYVIIKRTPINACLLRRLCLRTL